jgi:hypothetical protein
MAGTARRTGRPTKPAKPGKRVSLGLKVTGEIKQRLDAAAQTSGRTQSQEAEVRLEQSFRDESLLPQILDSAYGRQTAGLLMLLGRGIKEASALAAFSATFSLDAVDNWMSHPWAYKQAIEAVQLVLDELRPPGDAEPPKINAGLTAISEDLREAADHIGRGVAVSLLHSVAAPDTAALGDGMKEVRERLGATVTDRLLMEDSDAG